MLRTRYGHFKQRQLSSLAVELSAADTDVGNHKKKITDHARYLRVLSLNGSWPSWDTASRRPIDLFPAGKGLELEQLNFGLPWEEFDVQILGRLQINFLTHLSIPIKEVTDLKALGMSLGQMTELQSLHIIDIPAMEPYLENLAWIGNGLRVLRKLKSLGISLVNPTRRAWWERDESFERQENPSVYFDAVFSPSTYGKPADEQRREYLLQRSQDPRDDVHSTGMTLAAWRPPLALERLYLKHIDVPIYAWEEVFRPETLEILQLPYCVAPKLWTTLETSKTQLKRLEGINFEMLSPELLSFLRTQQQLEVLEFMAGEDNYFSMPPEDGDDWWRMVPQSNNPLARAREGSYWISDKEFNKHVGFSPTGEAEYQGISDPKIAFLTTMESLHSLKKLTLTADMFVITQGFFLEIGLLLTSLEELELGFDYQDEDLFSAFCEMTWHLPQLKKMTFRSLSRPKPLPDYSAEFIYRDWLRHYGWSLKLSPTLRHVRMLESCENSHKGKYSWTHVFYRRDEPAPRDGRSDFWYYRSSATSDQVNNDAFEAGSIPTLAELDSDKGPPCSIIAPDSDERELGERTIDDLVGERSTSDSFSAMVLGEKLLSAKEMILVICAAFHWADVAKSRLLKSCVHPLTRWLPARSLLFRPRGGNESSDADEWPEEEVRC